MDKFTISQLSQFSGIKPHTIRIWEQRYQALSPHRSKGNTRYYDGSQLRRLLNIVSLSGMGIKLSRLGAMSDEELFKMIQEKGENAGQDNNYEYFVNQLLSAGMNFDDLNFEKIFSHCLLRFGMFKTYVDIIYPMLNRIGLLWSTNNIPPSQEHYISNLLRQKIFTAIDSIPSPKEGMDSWLLFLPEDEFHEIGLLFSNYLIRSNGGRVIYLGPNAPLSSIQSTLQETEINKLLLFLVHRDLPENIGEYLGELIKVAGDKRIFIAADKEFSEKVSTTSPFTWVHSVEDLESEIGKEPQI